MFWASKLHFYLSDDQFYNYPYFFGFLFGLAIYAQREVLGERFQSVYDGLLQDTGRMDAEDIAMKHLNTSMGTAEFWEAGVEI
ncbi:unnamed protein product, partial [Discosporangium mesarthrocarpum]